jgi:hypothetical protein
MTRKISEGGVPALVAHAHLLQTRFMPNDASFESFEKEFNRLVESFGKRLAELKQSEKATLQNAVTATDQQIDALVYELYGLTKDEIKLVEGGQ